MLNRVLDQSKQFALDILHSHSIAVDATSGNGNDTLFLLDNISNGKVYAFDVQQQAIESTYEKVSSHKHIENLTLIHDSHENVLNYVEKDIDVAMFNLGFLPNADKTITTLSHSTIVAIDRILSKLSVGGRVIITIYHGHKNGKDEKRAVLEFAESLDQHFYNVLMYRFINQKNNAPFIIVIERRKLTR